MKFIQKVKVH